MITKRLTYEYLDTRPNMIDMRISVEAIIKDDEDVEAKDVLQAGIDGAAQAIYEKLETLK